MEQFIGEIRMFGGNYAPEGWALCDGKILPIEQNEPLFALIGTTYGGDGQTTFALPDLRGRIPLHQGTNPGTGTSYQIGSMSGTETVTLTENQMPHHTHGVAASTEDGQSKNPENAFWAGDIGSYSTEQPNATMHPEAITSTGGNQAHRNMMPFLTINFIISLSGIYPSRN